MLQYAREMIAFPTDLLVSWTVGMGKILNLKKKLRKKFERTVRINVNEEKMTPTLVSC